MKFLRTPAKWIIRKLASYLSETDIKDLNSGLRAFRRDVAMQYVHELPKGFSCVTTLTMSFLGNGYKIAFFPIQYFPRAGSSKFHWLKDTRRYILQVVRMTLSYNPLKVFLPIGLALLSLGLVKLVIFRTCDRSGTGGGASDIEAVVGIPSVPRSIDETFSTRIDPDQSAAEHTRRRGVGRGGGNIAG